jgi:hypothetical protein
MDLDHKFTSGSVLSQTFSVFFGNFPAFMVICGLVLAPALVLRGFGLYLGPDEFDTTGTSGALGMMLNFLGILLTIPLSPLATGAMTYGVFQHVRGRHASIGDCLGTGLKRLLPVLGVSIIAGIIQMLGTVMCIVPGIIAAVILAAAVPAAVIENPGVFASLRRSESLTEGYRWPVFGVVFGIWVINFVLALFATFLTFVSPLLYIIVTLSLTIVFTGLNAAASALIYYHLRMTKEAIDLEEIAAVFD